MKIKAPHGISHGRRAIALAAAGAPLAVMLAGTDAAAAATSATPATDAASGASAVNAASTAGSSVSGQPVTLPEFISLSETLTARQTLDPIIADRALKDLTAEDPTFPSHAAALAKLVANEQFKDMTKFADFASRHPDAKPTAMKIISAWYLGYTGTPAMHSSVDDARFVAYAGALMYEPTADATVVPSYSRGHTNYWAKPPASIKND